MAEINLQRVYDFNVPAPEHCYLIDRLWPRGISKERLQGVIWLKQVAPDNALRQWFHQNTEQWDEFELRYRQQLAEHDAWQPLVTLLQQGQSLTLLYGSKDTQRNQGIVLRDFLLEQSQT
ncbi:MarR family transcriptional regulator [Serratia sp. S1B]|nr:MarR family transcriptional regulator [Serratia sp. S1B]